MGELKDKAVKGIAWNTIQSLTNKSISFLFLIIMARLLLPADYGMVGMLAVFIAISEAFIDCGFGQAIIRKQDRTRVDESTVYYFSIIASCICYLIIFIIAPYVAKFYNMPELCALLRFLGLKIVIASFSTMQVLKYTIELNFKTPAIIKVSSNLLSGIIGIYFAKVGYGPWALAIQQVLLATFNSIFFIVISKWRPILKFSMDSFHEMFSFGSKLLGARLLNIIYANISAIFIGKAYSSEELGLYSKGNEMASYPSDILYGIVSTVSYPLLCTLQDDIERLSQAYRKVIRTIGFVVYPVMTIVCVLAEPIILTLFGEKWVDSAMYMALLCYPFMIVPICGANFSLLQVAGRSDLVLRLEIITKILGTVMLLITLPISVKAMCIGTIVNVTLCLIVNTHYTSRYVNLTQWQQILDLIKPFLMCIVMGALVWCAVHFIDNNIIKLLVGVPLGFLIYYGTAAISQSPEYLMSKELVYSVRSKSKSND